MNDINANHHPKHIAHRMLPGLRYRSDDGIEWSAESALRSTVRDFLYNAGFHIGKPNGCAVLMA